MIEVFKVVIYNDNKERVVIGEGNREDMIKLKSYLQKYFTKTLILENDYE